MVSGRLRVGVTSNPLRLRRSIVSACDVSLAATTHGLPTHVRTLAIAK